ncbi:hypothetical protein [Stenotrophomonas lacuserhaii]|uniref:hypothetical protein n=1 Tax=Stenotrophomonas lacuserhaii TaxID=2760084 RepID=UPI0015FDC65E|nr:hypothetical protein [Stenotrophomonas lacuserhaii]
MTDQEPVTNGSFTIVDQKNLLATTKQIPHIPVPLHQWTIIREKTGQIGGEHWVLPGIATTFFGGVLAAGFAIATAAEEVSTKDACWFLALCAIATIGFGTAAFMRRDRNKATAREVLSTINSVESVINMPS